MTIGLVSYGSSDDEAEAPVSTSTDKPHNTRAMNPNNSTGVFPAGDEQKAAAESPSEVAMVGPSMPNDNGVNMIDTYEDDVDQEIPPMSERDLLRYLTQPSYPIMSLPAVPVAEADPAVTAKFKRFLELKAKGIHFNEDLATKSTFQNPSLFASLLERSGLSAESQYTLAVPPDVFRVQTLPVWGYKEELLKSQQALNTELEATKKAQSVAGKRRIEFASAGDSRSREPMPKGGLT